MKRFFLILVLVCLGSYKAESLPQSDSAAAASQTATAQTTTSQTAPEATGRPHANAADANARQARGLVNQAIAALGGQNYLQVRDREQQGRTYTLHHGQQTSNGIIFWSFNEFPDKERVELTKERDITELYVGNKAYEITYKGVHPIEQKDLVDYLRRRQYSLDVVLRNWVNDPGVIFLLDGHAIAAQHEAEQVTLVNAKDEAVTLYFDADTHLPIKKSFEWRDPVDRQKNLEEEIYENYRAVSGIMAPYNITRYFNGDMAAQRFLNSVTINQGLDKAMFDPNSGYNPNKQSGKR